MVAIAINKIGTKKKKTNMYKTFNLNNMIICIYSIDRLSYFLFYYETNLLGFNHNLFAALKTTNSPRKKKRTEEFYSVTKVFLFVLFYII